MLVFPASSGKWSSMNMFRPCFFIKLILSSSVLYSEAARAVGQDVNYWQEPESLGEASQVVSSVRF